MGKPFLVTVVLAVLLAVSCTFSSPKAPPQPPNDISPAPIVRELEVVIDPNGESTITPVPTCVPEHKATPEPTSKPAAVSTFASSSKPSHTTAKEPILAPSLSSAPRQTLESTSTPAPAIIALAAIKVAAGATQQLEATIEDQQGRTISETHVVWTVQDANAGSVSPSGLFTAGEVAGTFEDALLAKEADGELAATGSVTIFPGPLAQVVIVPDPAEIGMEMTQRFVAAGADRFGNRISGIKFAWSVEAGAGTIDANGVFTAGLAPGKYCGAVHATTTQADITRSAVSMVTVEPERIAFLSNRDVKQLTDLPDLYIMNADGSNVNRITRSGVAFDSPSWSPNGRRFAYNDGHNIYASSDDGVWAINLLSGAFRGDNPAWSPDGTRIAFQSFEPRLRNPADAAYPHAEIFAMDVDGGNRTRLTDNPYRDDQPSWSPDSKKVVFIIPSTGNDLAQLYVVDADGSNLRLVTDSGDSAAPSWSPDGTEIAVQSRPGLGSWYTINVIEATASSGGLRQLTHGGVGDWTPGWSNDGEFILFHSFRDSNFRNAQTAEQQSQGVELYLMDRSGSNVARLTDNNAFDGFGAWAPRKRGVEVSEASVVFLNSSNLAPRPPVDVVAEARPAVVRIETALVSGSGFIIDGQGHILTNNHLIRDAEHITVFLDDGSERVATVQGRDLVRNLAVVRIKATGLPWLPLADISRTPLGAEVLVLGFPLTSPDLNVTKGSVSSFRSDTGRNIRWLQTDSAINPGQSGGPMLNLQGEVIGIATANFVGVDTETLGFAISANTVALYLDRLRNGEVIKR